MCILCSVCSICRHSNAGVSQECLTRTSEDVPLKVTPRVRTISDMLLLVMSLMYWTRTEGGCSETTVSIFGDDRVLPAGKSFNMSCKFTCLGPQHMAQLWRDDGHEARVPLINITSTLSDVIIVLSISSATVADTGYYSCMTYPPHSISPQVLVQIADNQTTPTMTTSSTPQCDCSQQPNSIAGLLGQMWFWILLGKIIILLLSLAALAVTYNRC